MAKKIFFIVAAIGFVIFMMTGGRFLWIPILDSIENTINSRKTERAIKEHTDGSKVALQALEQLFKDNQESFLIRLSEDYIVLDNMKRVELEYNDFFYVEAKFKPVFPLEELFENTTFFELDSTFLKRKIVFGEDTSLKSKEEMINLFGGLENLKQTVEFLIKSKCYEFIKAQNCLVLTYFTKDKVDLYTEISFCLTCGLFDFRLPDFGFKVGVCDLEAEAFELDFPYFDWYFGRESIVDISQ